MAANSFWKYGVLIAQLSFVSYGPMNTAEAATLEQQRDLFRDIYAQVQDGDIGEQRAQLPKLKTYPLYPWIEYEFLLDNFEDTSDKKLVEFAEKNPHSLMSDTIYVRLANRLSNLDDWKTLLKLVPPHPEHKAIQCYRAEALFATGQKTAGLEAGKAIWYAADHDLPPDCNGLLKQLRDNKALSREDYWHRIRGLIDNNYLTVAKIQAAYLSDSDEKLVELWANVRRSPSSHLDEVFEQEDSAHAREIIVYGINRAADKKLQPAIRLWDEAQQKFDFTPAEKGAVESKLGRWEAWRHDEAGFERLRKIPAEHRTTEGNIWLARIALRTGRWEEVLEAVNDLEASDDEESQDDAWPYWKGRALEQLGRDKEARNAYAQIASDTTFYGFMAADRLGRDYERLQAALPDRNQRIEGLHKLAAVQRWEEWLALGERGKARREWFRMLENMDKEGMLAAAELAARQGDHNLAIWTVSRTRDWNVVDLRFPLLYEDVVLEKSRSHGVNPAWVLGVMRRESAFNEGAESSARALGLMQLMPATAREVGRKLGLNVSGRNDILQPKTNVQLGSAYLRDMYKRFSGNYAQATAAYNAGPGRIPKWAPNENIDADRWVESIPFNETRRYVRTVMAYTTIYDHKLHADEGIPLSLRLKPIEPD